MERRLEIRNATLADVPEIERCIREAYAPYTARIGKPPAALTMDVGAAVEAKTMRVGSIGEDVIGCVALLHSQDEVQLRALAILPAYQRSGYGRGFVAYAESEAQEQGRARVTLFTN